MKKLISKFSDKLLSKQKLKTVKGGTCYCNCTGDLYTVSCGTDCNSFCYGQGGNICPPGGWIGPNGPVPCS